MAVSGMNHVGLVLRRNQIKMTDIIKIKDTEIWVGDCIESLRQMPEESVNCVVTSPPYWGLRDYGCDGQIGLEQTPGQFIQVMVDVFRKVRRVLRSDGTLWLNLGDSYLSKPNPDKCDNKNIKGRNRFDRPNTHPILGLKPKNLVGMPWRVALALQADGWYLRQDIIWHKPNPMPESCRDRCTKAHEYIFLLSKSARYHYDQDAIREPTGHKGNANGFRGGAYCNGNTDNATLGKRTQSGNQKVPAGWDVGPGSHGSYHREGRGKSAYSFARKTATQGALGQPDQHRPDREPKFYRRSRNKRSVWTVATHPYKGAHFATFPPALIEPCILAGCSKGGTVLDPFGGSGTTAYVANSYGRKAILCELNPANVPLIRERLGCGFEIASDHVEKKGQGDLFPEMGAANCG